MFEKFTTNAIMPRWACEPDTDLGIKLAIASFKNGPYKSREDAVKFYSVDPKALRRQLNGKYKSYKIGHT